MIANRRPVELEGIRAIHKLIKVMENTTGNLGLGRQWIFLFVVANDVGHGTSLVEIASGSSREAVVMAEAELGFKLNVTSLCIRERLPVEPDKFALLDTDEYNGVARDELNPSAATNGA
ncbi:hypothetical protein ONZ45_g5917 [Pleurotus djamor]|nr:hypothetical protein ONZ45_g5917 [Pleurotus djamor]